MTPESEKWDVSLTSISSMSDKKNRGGIQHVRKIEKKLNQPIFVWFL